MPKLPVYGKLYRHLFICRYMRRKFLLWLFALLLSVFVVTGALAYFYFTHHAEERAAQTMSTRLSDLMELIRHAEAGTQHVMEMNDAGALQRTRALAELLRLNPALLKHQEALQGICNELGAAQIVVTDASGEVIASVPEHLVGYRLGEHEQSQEFMACVDDADAEICQRPHANGQEKLTMQYTGVHRRDARGVVQLGIVTPHEQVVRADASFGKLAANFSLGENGRIVAFRGGALLSGGSLPCSEAELLALPVGKAVPLVLQGEDFYAYAMEQEGYRLVGVLPAADVYRSRGGVLRSLLLSNLVLFLLMFAAVFYLLQYYVVRSIKRVDESLRHITEGDLDTRVMVVGDTPEMIRLSTGLNAMLDALQYYAEEKRENMQRELELARSIQMSAIPGKFPAFPNRAEFDLYAVCAPALTVGGDFYDFFLIDENHLCFMVADCSENGIPAALYMMSSLSVIRSHARTGADPVTLMTETNRALCEGGKGKDIHMSLFYGELEISSGRVRYANAGSSHALLQHAGGAFERLSVKSGMVLGVYDAAEYAEGELQLEVGDRIFLYTEGVLSSSDAENTPFGEMRLQEALGMPAARVSDVLLQVRSSLRRFMGEAEQRQDVTMLALEFQGRKRATGRREVPAGKPEGLPEMFDELMEAVLAAPSDIADMKASCLSVLAALEPELSVEVQLQCDEKQAELSFSYPGARYNPMITLPHLPVNSVRYSYADDRNLLTLHKELV